MQRKRTLHFWLAALLVCVLCSAASITTAQPQQFGGLPAPGRRMPTPILHGYVAMIPLDIFAFAPPEIGTAFGALVTLQTKVASPRLQAELRRHPDDLAVWIGYMQCRPDLWTPECARLEKRIAAVPSDTVSRFKLGTLIYYRWHRADYRLVPLRQPAGHGEPAETEDRAAAERAHTLVHQAWMRDHKTLYGLTLMEMRGFIGHLGPREPVFDPIVRDLAGPVAYAAYDRAEHHGWKGDPPPQASVPAIRRAALGYILEGAHIPAVHGSARSPGAVGPVKPGIDGGLTAEKAAKSAFVGRWLKILRGETLVGSPAWYGERHLLTRPGKMEAHFGEHLRQPGRTKARALPQKAQVRPRSTTAR